MRHFDWTNNARGAPPGAELNQSECKSFVFTSRRLSRCFVLSQMWICQVFSDNVVNEDFEH